MIELIVGMVLLSIILAAISGPLINSLSTANHGATYTASHQKVRAALAQITQDLDPAQAADRTPQKVRTWRSLMDALTAGPGGAMSEDPAASGSIDVYDILTATATNLQFRSDVSAATPGIECVDYTIGPAASYSVTRTVYRNGTCGGARLSRRQLMKPQPLVPSMASVPTFRYQVTCNAAQATGWGPVGGFCGGSSTCTPRIVPSVGGPTRNAIVAIVVDFHDLEARAGQATAAANAAVVPLTSRASTMFQRALGCA